MSASSTPDRVIDSQFEPCSSLEVVPDSDNEDNRTPGAKSPSSSVVIVSDEDVEEEELKHPEKVLTEYQGGSTPVLVLSDSESEEERDLSELIEGGEELDVPELAEPVSSIDSKQEEVNMAVAAFLEQRQGRESTGRNDEEKEPRLTGLNKFKYEAPGPSTSTPKMASVPRPNKQTAKRRKAMEDPHFPKDKLDVLTTCAFCKLAWTTAKTRADKLGHLKSCAKREGYSEDVDAVRALDDHIVKLARVELDRLSQEKRPKSLFDRAIGKGGGSIRPVRVVHAEDEDVEVIQMEIDLLKKKPLSSKLRRVAERILEERGEQLTPDEVLSITPVPTWTTAQESVTPDYYSESPFGTPMPTQSFPPSNVAEQRSGEGFDVFTLSNKENSGQKNRGVSLWSAASGQLTDLERTYSTHVDPPVRPILSPENNRVYEMLRQNVYDMSTLVLSDDSDTSNNEQEPSYEVMDCSDLSLGLEEIPNTSETVYHSGIATIPNYEAMTVEELQDEVVKYGFKASRQKAVLVSQMRRIWVSLYGSQSLSDATEPSDEKEVAAALRRAIMDDKELYTRVLCYEPLFLDELQQFVRRKGLKVTKPILSKWLDGQSITYYAQNPKLMTRRKGRYK